MEHIYVGKKCPYCKTLFKQEDAVAFCSACNMPHHLSCWQANEGCTTFGCKGLIDTIINQENAGKTNEPAAPAVDGKKAAGAGGSLKKDEVRFEILFEQTEGKLQDDSGILIEKVSLIKDNAEDTVFARCCFRSLTDDPIKALLIDITAKDVWGNQIPGVEGFQLLDLKTKRDSQFGQTTPIPMPDKHVRAIDVIITKVLYEDHRMADCKESFSILPAQQLLSDYLGNSDRAAQYARETSEYSRYVPVAGARVWRCSCGAINELAADGCYRCKALRLALMKALDPEQIRLRTDAYLEEKRLKDEAEQREREKRQREDEERLKRAQAEKERQDREAAEARRLQKKKRRGRIAGIAAGVIILAAAVYGTVWHLVPYARYCGAKSDVEKYRFDSAYDTYILLGDYRDSSMKAVETLYAKGEYLIGQQQYLEAAAAFERIPRYLDSQDKAVDCRIEGEYRLGIQKYEEKDYAGAAAVFASLGEYSDSVAWLDKTNYSCAMDCFQRGDYQKAIEMFTALGDYADADAWVNESRFQQAEAAYDSKDYKTAYTCYESLPGEYKQSGDKAKNSKYLYACECIGRTEYRDAIDAFKALGYYQDSFEKYKESAYLYARDFYDAGDYANATLYFSIASGHEDAEDMRIDSKYHQALELYDRGEYTEAVNLLSVLGNYKECKAKMKEAQYAYVNAHMDNTDSTTYSYLSDLKAAGYLNAKAIYNDLYEWKAEMIFNTDEKDYYTNKKSISKYNHIFVHVILKGGAPGETIKMKYSYSWPGGTAKSGSWEDIAWRSNNVATLEVWLTNPALGQAGNFSCSAYTSEGKTLVSGSVSIN